ncbi:MAG: bifunctional precorrin-2 dehydrogenase/sirohydrochlorin ferrochelatase [Dehalococcoidia bacterium]
MSVIVEILPSAGPALIVGGGAIALRKARNLAEGEFEITVVAPEVDPAVRQLPFVTVIEGPFSPDHLDLRRFALVLACTNDRAVNEDVGRLARARRLPVLVADAQEESTFFTPATIREGDLTIAVSTGGASPSLAREVRERIIASLGPSWGRIAGLVRQEREQRDERRRARQQG